LPDWAYASDEERQKKGKEKAKESVTKPKKR